MFSSNYVKTRLTIIHVSREAKVESTLDELLPRQSHLIEQHSTYMK